MKYLQRCWLKKNNLMPESSQSIKIGIEKSIDKSIEIGESDLIDIDCIDQSAEIDDTPSLSISCNPGMCFLSFYFLTYTKKQQ